MHLESGRVWPFFSRGTAATLLVASLWAAGLPFAEAQDVLTYHNDNARTGQNTNETILRRPTWLRRISEEFSPSRWMAMSMPSRYW